VLSAPVILRVALFLPLIFSQLHAADPAPPQFQLPDSAYPRRYAIELTIDPSQESFQGVATIDLQLTERLPFVWLNGTGITVQQAVLRAGGETTPARVVYARDEFIGFALGQPAGPGPAQLEVRYQAALSDKSTVGAYRRQSEGEWYAFTTFTAIEARRAFPCFDEPRYKTPWQLTLHVKREHVALTNTPPLTDDNEPGGMKKITFAPTALLPSELIAFAVGPFEIVDAGRAGKRQIPIRIITPHGRAAEAAYTRTVDPELLTRLEEYTGIPYPFEKLDHIALLEGAFGAVENPGLITYQQRTLLAKPEQDTADRQRGMRGTMAHELAHQWFGNLVTMSTWQDVWLSEGFATWLGSKIADQDQPESRRRVSMAASRDRIMAADAPANARPVRVAFSSREGMRDVYNRLVYEKGAGVLRTLEGWIGEEPFRQALRAYLTAYAFENATTDELAAAISESTGRDAGAIMSSLLDQPGAPVIDAELQCADQTPPRVLLRQQRYRPLGATVASPRWSTPVCVTAEGGSRKCTVLENQQAEIVLDDLPACPAWIFPNAGATGYYRSQLSAPLLDALVQHGFDHLSAAERLTAVLDMNALVRNGHIPAAQALKLLPKLARDAEPQVVVAAVSLANSLAPIVPAALRPKFDEFLRTTFGGVPAAKPEEIELLRGSQEKSVAEFLSK
jgi:cytosol alanyl aminopeptidase